MMGYEKLDVYQCSIEFLGIAATVIEKMPRGYSILTDQLKRSSLGLPLQIAEGAGKRSKIDCRRFYDYARGSAMECGAVLDACLKLKLIDNKLVKDGKNILERIVAMLTKLAM